MGIVGLMSRATSAAYRIRQRAKGLCQHDGNPVAPGFKECQRCIDRRRAYYQANRTKLVERSRVRSWKHTERAFRAGLCYACNGDSEDASRCPGCKAKARTNRRIRAIKRRKAKRGILRFLRAIGRVR